MSSFKSLFRRHHYLMTWIAYWPIAINIMATPKRKIISIKIFSTFITNMWTRIPSSLKLEWVDWMRTWTFESWLKFINFLFYLNCWSLRKFNKVFVNRLQWLAKIIYCKLVFIIHVNFFLFMYFIFYDLLFL
jgi:hypothetical protein